MTETLGAHKAREIWARINHRLDLCERGIHEGLGEGGALAEVRAREVRIDT